MKLLGMTLLALLFTASGVLGAGFLIPEQSTPALGMSAAMTARNEDLSAIYYNPAGLNYVQNNEVTLGLTPVLPTHSYEGNGVTATANRNIFPLPQLYFGHRMNESVVFGLGIYSPWGLGTSWGEEWVGRYSSVKTQLSTFSISPAISYQFNDMFSFGGRFSWIYSDAHMSKMVDTGLLTYSTLRSFGGQLGYSDMGDPSIVANADYDTKFLLQGGGGAFSYMFGTLVKPTQRLQIGLSYNRMTSMEFDGEAFFHMPKDIIFEEIHDKIADNLTQAEIDSLYPIIRDRTVNQIAENASVEDEFDPGEYTDYLDGIYDGTSAPKTHVDFLTQHLIDGMKLAKVQNAEAYYRMPHAVNLGLKYDISDRLDAEVDLNYMMWEKYEVVTIDLDKDIPQETIEMQKQWENSIAMRFGTSFAYSEMTTLRLGGLFDQSPVSDMYFDSQLPDGNRIGVSAGITRPISFEAALEQYTIELNAGYMFLFFMESEKNNLVGYSDVGRKTTEAVDLNNNGTIDAGEEEGTPKVIPSPDGQVTQADKTILDNLSGPGGYPVGNGTYNNTANLFSVSATYRF